jgi:FKBP-type peptidyl-prolyl cis-trans isomerase
MNSYYSTLFALLLLLAIASCTKDTSVLDRREQELRLFDLYVQSNYPGAELKQEGLYYNEHREGTGATAGAEDWLIVNHVGYELPEDNVFVSYIENVVQDHDLDPEGIALYGPYKMLNGSVNQGLAQGISLMRKGGQATILFTSTLGYGNKGNSLVGPYASLKYEVELLEVIPDIDVYEQEKIESYLDTIADFITVEDTATNSEMYVIIDHATEGQLIVADSAVSLTYKGQLIDGRIFDEADAENPYEFTQGQADHIIGWDLGLVRLREGEKARLLIPYQLAYGEAGRTERGLQAIPPYETLLFEIEVLKVGGETDDNGEIPVEQ